MLCFVNDFANRQRGLEGIAQLRAIVGDVDDEAFIDQRLAETARILTARGDPYPAGQPSAQPVDTRTGYDLWAPTYDSEHNLLLAAEQAVVWPWMNQLPPGLAVDTACGTGRYASPARRPPTHHRWHR